MACESDIFEERERTLSFFLHAYSSFTLKRKEAILTNSLVIKLKILFYIALY